MHIFFEEIAFLLKIFPYTITRRGSGKEPHLSFFCVHISEFYRLLHIVGREDLEIVDMVSALILHLDTMFEIRRGDVSIFFYVLF